MAPEQPWGAKRAGGMGGLATPRAEKTPPNRQTHFPPSTGALPTRDEDLSR
jgi:hypothetical protein